jgi:preprotein translocase subunit YajC
MLPSFFLGMMGPSPNGQQGSNPMGMLMPMLIIFGIFYFMMIRPQQRKEKDRRKMIDEVKSGDRVLFSGGIIGVVANVKDQVLVVKVAENVKIEIARGAVNRVLDKDEKVAVEPA